MAETYVYKSVLVSGSLKVEAVSATNNGGGNAGSVGHQFLSIGAARDGYFTSGANKQATWSTGDTITLQPGTYHIGGFGLSGLPGTYTINMAGCDILVSDTATYGDDFNITTPVVLNGPFTLANSISQNAMQIDCRSGDVMGVFVNDMTIVAHLTNAGGGIGALRIQTGTLHGVTATFNRLKCNLDGDYRDHFIVGNGTNKSTRASRIFLNDCEISGCHSGAGDNCVSLDSGCEMFINGGIFHDAGGACLSQGNFTQGGRLHVRNATVYNAGISNTGEGVGIRAATIENCRVYGCTTAIVVDAGDDGLGQRGMARVSGCYLKRALNRLSGNNTKQAGIRMEGASSGVVGCPGLVIENCTIEGWHRGVGSTSGDFECGVYGPQIDGACLTLVDVTFIDNYIDIYTLGGFAGCFVDCEDVVFAPKAYTLAGSQPEPALFDLNGKDATNTMGVRFVNCIANYPSNYDFLGRSANCEMYSDGGFNWWYQPNVNDGSGLTNDGTVGVSATDMLTFSSDPLIQADGRISDISPAQGWTRQFPQDQPLDVAVQLGFATATVDSTHVTASALAGAGASFYVGFIMTMSNGAPTTFAVRGETRTVSAYNTATGAFTVSVAFSGTPASGSYFSLMPATPALPLNPNHVRLGTASSGSVRTAVSNIDTSALAADYFKGQRIQFPDNTTTAGLRGRWSTIIGNDVSATSTLTFSPPLPAAVANTDTFAILPPIVPRAGCTSDLVQGHERLITGSNGQNTRDTFGIPHGGAKVPSTSSANFHGGRRAGAMSWPPNIRQMPRDMRGAHAGSPTHPDALTDLK